MAKVNEQLCRHVEPEAVDTLVQAPETNVQAARSTA